MSRTPRPPRLSATPHYAPVTPRYALVTPHYAPVTPRYTPVTPRYAPVTPRYAPVTPRCAPVTPRYTPVTPHYAPVTPHYAPVTPRYTPVTPRYAPVTPRYAPVTPRYAPVKPRYTPVTPRYAPVKPRYAPVTPRYAPVTLRRTPTKPRRAPSKPRLNTHRRVAAAAALIAVLCAAAVLGGPPQAQAAGEAAADKPVYLDLRLMGADLVDELVYSWTKDVPFKNPRPVALVEVAAPVGLDERFGVLVENRLYELLRANPNIPVKLTHCGLCTQMVAKSTKLGTRIGRGIDQPEVLSGLIATSPDRLAMSLGFEVEGRELVLRAQIFELAGSQPIVWAKTFATSMSARRILRETTPLISLEEARKNQHDLLIGRDPIEVVTRFSVRSFTLSDTTLGSTTAPLIFYEQSFEGVLLPYRAKRAAVTAGFTSIKDSIQGFSVGGHLAQLLLRDQPSLAEPDVYLFGGFNYVRLRGPGAEPFGAEEMDIDNLLRERKEPKATLLLYRLGLETHIKYRYGAMAFLEYAPLLKTSKTIETARLLGILYQDLGIGMVIRW